MSSTPDTPTTITTQTTLDDIPVITPSKQKNRRARIVAKHAPSRTSSRFYAQVRTITGALEEAERTLRRSTLSGYRSDQVTKKISEYRKRLTAVREEIPIAVKNWDYADVVKEELKTLVKLSNALPDVITDLDLQERVVAARKHDLEDKTVLAVLADGAQVAAALQEDDPGKIVSRSKRLRLNAGAVLA